MQANAALDTLWPRISECVADRMGLHFPLERRADLQRGLAEAAVEFGFADATACASWILSTRPTASELHTLASHLTIGETYFFRDRKTFDALASRVLPELIRSRRGRDQHLRLWSAACSTGEEAYSLAILLHELLPDWRDWRVTILGTDINERFLQKAAAGVYGEWSFRESPPEFKERYFTQTADRRFAIVPEIRERVSFARMNLAQSDFQTFAPDVLAMDVIFCRNLLIYFTPPQTRKLVENLRGALTDDGWLAVSPSECSQSVFARFGAVNFPGAILYRKRKDEERISPEWAATPLADAAETVSPIFDSVAEAPTERFEDTATPAAAATAEPPDIREAADARALARALANEGKLPEALAAIEQRIAADKLDATAHYLHAMVLQELGERALARASLQRAVYLQPDFALAHFALGNCARGDARGREANKHFANALQVLRGRPQEELVPEADGLTAGRLTEIISTLASQGELSQ